jgi:hypothetical protein
VPRERAVKRTSPSVPLRRSSRKFPLTDMICELQLLPGPL